MDAKEIQQLRPMLNAYLRKFDDCFGRREPMEHLKHYVLGQLSDLPRKSLEPIADAAGILPRTLQQFLAIHDWNHERVRDLLSQRVAQRPISRRAVGIIDETSHVKKGNKTAGVQRQWCGRLGKVENCVTTVHLGYADGDFHCLLDSDLFLPQPWSEDRSRCRGAGIPDNVIHRPKWQIALELRDRAVANGVNLEWLTFDENYPMNPEFLFALDDRGQHYAGEVKRTYTGWLTKPALLYKRHHCAAGPSGHFPRVKRKDDRPITFENMLTYSTKLRKITWEKFHIKDTHKGPMVWEAKAVEVYLKRDGLPTRPHTLVITRNVENPQEIKYCLANAPSDTPLTTLLHVIFSRWHVERCFEDEKSELGLSDFEIRNYKGLRRHLIATSVTHLFLAEVQQAWRKKKSGINGLSGADSQFRAGSFPLDLRAGPPELFAEDGCHNHPDTRPQQKCPREPHEDQTEAVA